MNETTPDPDPGTFRRLLAARILALLGAASLGGCWDGETVLTGFGGGPAGTGGATTGSTTTDSTTTGSTTVEGTTTSLATSTCWATSGAPCGAWPAVRKCFTPASLPCPTDPCVALAVLNSGPCDTDGLQACQINSGPTEDGGACCYQTTAELCGSGGRPYLVDDRAVVAAPLLGAGDRGWSEGDRPDVGALTAAERASLAEAWTASGLMEHASVASFSRVSLSLLAAGAPAELIARTHRAALDEIVHARLCFALASAYRGETVAPGPFPVAGSVPVSTSLASIAASTVEEGCVGETVAAVIAAEQLSRATDPAVRAALTRIAADEARHAELAFRTVAWAVKVGGAEVRSAVARALLGALGGVCKTPPAEGPPGESLALQEGHGLLDGVTVARVVAAAMTEVVAPAGRALLASAPATCSCP